MPKNVTVDEGKGCHCGWRTKDESLWMRPKDEARLMRPKDEWLLKKTKAKIYKCPQLMNFWISWERRDPTAWAVDKGHLTNYNIWLWKGRDKVITFFVVVFALKSCCFSFTWYEPLYTLTHVLTHTYTIKQAIKKQTQSNKHTQRNKHTIQQTNTNKETNTQTEQKKRHSPSECHTNFKAKQASGHTFERDECNPNELDEDALLINSCSVSEHLLNCELNTLPFSLPKVWLCERFSVVQHYPMEHTKRCNVVCLFLPSNLVWICTCTSFYTDYNQNTKGKIINIELYIFLLHVYSVHMHVCFCVNEWLDK